MKAGIVAVLSWFVGTILLMPSMVVKPICDLERKLEKKQSLSEGFGGFWVVCSDETKN